MFCETNQQDLVSKRINALELVYFKTDEKTAMFFK